MKCERIQGGSNLFAGVAVEHYLPPQYLKEEENSGWGWHVLHYYLYLIRREETWD